MLRLFIADLKMIFRNRQASFMAFVFPLVFIIIFGFFYGGNSTLGTVSVINKSNSTLSKNLSAALEDSALFKIDDKNNLNQDEIKNEISAGKISAAIEIPQDFGKTNSNETKVKIYYDQSNAQINSSLEGFLNIFLTSANYKMQNAKEIYTTEKISVNSGKTLNYFDFVLIGIIGLAIMQSSIFLMAPALAKYREEQILKRIATTPIKNWWFVLAETFSRLVINFFQIIIILIVGVYCFDANIYGNIPLLFAFSLIGAILFQLVGFVIASFAKTTDAAQGMAMSITVPMMFLAGIFFPIDSLPKLVYSIVQYLPLAPLLRILRNIALYNKSPFDNINNLTIVAVWILVLLFISIKKFRLSEE